MLRVAWLQILELVIPSAAAESGIHHTTRSIYSTAVFCRFVVPENRKPHKTKSVTMETACVSAEHCGGRVPITPLHQWQPSPPCTRLTPDPVSNKPRYSGSGVIASCASAVRATGRVLLRAGRASC
ncbi:hypothetical protein BaRGS_00010021 [Batillaria attramentaria]|uniref:Secreted protein n=1 Tax=Batillaria attramentaria TaxID=370345 RepID=A0ABD0LGC3_9CAEN